jgi:hypothetical protein
MDDKKIKVCIFLHYSETNALPYYVQIYINELSNYFDVVKVLSNNSTLNSENSPFKSNIEFIYFENKGYDFGMFYRFVVKENLNQYSQLAIVNDSNLLIKKLDYVFSWANNTDADFWGIVDSLENPHFSNHKDNYHIQSHFIVLNLKAINLLPDFLQSVNVAKILEEENKKKLRRMIINDWEIGLSRFFIKHKLKCDSFIETKKMLKKYRPTKVNVTFSLFEEIIAHERYPLLKRKLATKKKKWYMFKKISLHKTILKYGEKEWELEKICSKDD